MTRAILFGSALVPALLLCAGAASAMGYDSLTCEELAERREGYFAGNGLCVPAAFGKAAIEPAGCKAAPEGAKSLPDPDRTQVEMIIKVETRKNCGKS